MSLDIQLFKKGFDIQKSRADIDTAYSKLQAIKEALERLEDNPDKYKAFNPPNNYGNYDNLIDFCKTVLQKCRENPDAVIEVSK